MLAQIFVQTVVSAGLGGGLGYMLTRTWKGAAILGAFYGGGTMAASSPEASAQGTRSALLLSGATLGLGALVYGIVRDPREACLQQATPEQLAAEQQRRLDAQNGDSWQLSQPGEGPGSGVQLLGLGRAGLPPSYPGFGAPVYPGGFCE